MHYEMTEDGDLGHIHVCKRFQKLIEIDDSIDNDSPPGESTMFLSKMNSSEAKKIIKEEIDLIYDQVKDDSEIEQLYNDYLKVDPVKTAPLGIIKNDLLGDKSDLEKKLGGSQPATHHRITPPLVSFGIIR